MFVLKGLADPYVLLLVVLGFAFWRRGRRVGDEPRRSRFWLWLPYLLLVAFSLPGVAYYLRGSLEWQNPPLQKRPADVDAIVVLGGAILHPGDWKIPPILNQSGVSRVQQAARFYHQGEPLPVLASAGPASGDPRYPSCADLMGELLEELGVHPDHILLEPRSTNTHENAVESARILREKGYKRILLVTDATHLPRALACFRKQGVDVVPGGSHYLSNRWRTNADKVLPTAQALETSANAGHEWVGWLWYWLRGWV